ncbi:hypothetical protein CVN56_31440 [Rhodococcus sp. AQ5-07]|uniref:hypothetical protein n=2 Tax=Nocardiaceae TaxID=85025 RepID=UPI0008726604|nr:hypothetical protein [Rhodococcus sp. 1139]OFE08352.1 hypothetical protein A5N83_12875 [Rhodococcus sp. 1139]RAL30752.1 hypothetical protein CVN56_31440 [Rhodococcus sp. AQ5-07]
MAEPQIDATYFRLPAERIEEGMSTADGQAVLGVIDTGVHVFVRVCDPSQVTEVHSAKHCDSKTRMFRVGELVDMATFADTAVDGATHHLARRCDESGQAGDR